MSRDYTEEDLIELVFYDLIQNWYQAIPAKVIKYDYTKQKATVQPLIKYRDRTAGVDSQGLTDMPPILSVPVMMIGTDESIISVPVKVNSTVMLFFSSRSIDNFTASDGKTTVDPQDLRIYQVNDCFAVPFSPIPFPKALGSDPSDVVIKMNVGTDNECSIALKQSGDVVATTPTKFIVEAAQNVEINTETATITASDSVTIDSPDTTVTGELRVERGVSVANDVNTDAGFSANTHKHIGNLGKPTSVFI